MRGSAAAPACLPSQDAEGREHGGQRRRQPGTPKWSHAGPRSHLLENPVLCLSRHLTMSSVRSAPSSTARRLSAGRVPKSHARRATSSRAATLLPKLQGAGRQAEVNEGSGGVWGQARAHRARRQTAGRQAAGRRRAGVRHAGTGRRAPALLGALLGALPGALLGALPRRTAAPPARGQRAGQAWRPRRGRRRSAAACAACPAPGCCRCRRTGACCSQGGAGGAGRTGARASGAVAGRG